MLTTQPLHNITLQPGVTQHFLNRARQRLSVRAGDGFVWLTRDGDIEDYVLRTGDAISLCAGDHIWLTLEQAERPVSLTLESLDPPRPLWGTIAMLFAPRAVQPCKVAVASAGGSA